MEPIRTYKKGVYATLQKISNAASTMQDMRITRMWPQTNWKNVWRNLKATPVQKSDLVTWYKAMHDIIPTNTRINRFNITNKDICTDCGKRDTLEHRLVECGEGTRTWQWASSRIARMLRTTPWNIQRALLIRPDFQLWPTQRQRAVLWMLALFVNFRLQKQRTLSAQDLVDFLRRLRRKLYTLTNRHKPVANLLTVLCLWNRASSL